MAEKIGMEETIEDFVFMNKKDANYYISRKPLFSKEIVQLLVNGITKMVKDIFLGYS